MRRSRASAWVAGTFLLALVCGPAVGALSQRPERPYGFIGTDHPIDMWRDGRSQWAYYGSGFEPSSNLAQKARAALGPLGFTEDRSEKPWYRFVKGDEEVVVCDHSEFAVNGVSLGTSRLVHNRMQETTQNYACVLVKNGPGTHESTTLFQVKKILHGW